MVLPLTGVFCILKKIVQGYVFGENMVMGQKIDLVKVDGFSCNDDVVLTVCNFYFHDYCEVFWNVFRFGFNHGKEIHIGKGFKENSYSVLENVRERYGLEFVVRYRSYSQEVRHYIEKKLKAKELLILGIDIFWCQWANDYKRRHNIHTLIITDICGQELVCADPGFKRVDIRIPLENLRKGFLHLIEPVHAGGKRSRTNAISDKQIYRSVKKNFRLDDIVSFMDAMKDFSPEKEFENETNIWYIPLYAELSKVYSAHVRFAQFLRKYEEATMRTEMLMLADDLNVVGGQWHAICLWIMKMHKDHVQKVQNAPDYKRQIIETLAGILNAEKDLFSGLTYVLKGKSNRRGNKKQIVCHYMILSFDVRSHLCGLELEDHEPLDVFKTGRRIETSNCSFKIQPPDENGNNVMTVHGQEIAVGYMAKSIYFLGCALWGNQVGEFEVYFEDGHKEIKRVFVSDWNEKEYLEEEIVWETTFKSTAEGVDDCRAKVVQFGFSFEKNQAVEKIVMPQGEKIHIFAVTVQEEIGS